MTETYRLQPLEYRAGRKLRFVAVALPILGILGGVMRMMGLSEAATILVVSLLLAVGFGLSILSARMDARQEAEDAIDRTVWQERDHRLQLDRQALIEQQLKELAKRHRAEHEALIRYGASREQLTAMIEQHSGDWDELIERLTA
jgi:septal ring factor EnvC (AmiA/AmiB activator)